jgi:hypothetical protein
LSEASGIAHLHEFNDHLATLYLIQGHIAWNGLPSLSARLPDRKEICGKSDFEAAMILYQHALIHALRYNRFVLDQALGGSRICAVPHPIIPHCLERGKEGRKMLAILRDWWQSGNNDIGVPRPDTISPIPEGVPLVEAEIIAREREPGDGSPQRTVLEQISIALR